MPQTFDCPACSETISAEVPPGSDVQCPLCRQGVTVPEIAAPEGIPVPEPEALPLSYASGDSIRRPGSRDAVGALVCGLISLVTACFPLGIVSIILGIRSMNRCKRDPHRYRGRGMAIVGIWLGGASFVTLVPAISVLSHLREQSRRTACAANLRGIMHAMYIYAADEPDYFPAIPPVGVDNTGAMRIFGGAAPGQVNPDRFNLPSGVGTPSPTVDLWALIRATYITPRQFICPSTTGIPDPATDTSAYYDFAGATNLSYAYQFQHDRDFPPIGTSSFPLLPLMADANPYIKGGITAGIKNDRLSGGRGNSLNHDRAGQNVLFQDGHGVFEKSPDCGLAGPTSIRKVSRGRDNIYTWYAPGAAVDPGSAAPTATMCNIGTRSDACLVP